MSIPILYSFRRCPYAIRARLALTVSEVQVELREIVLRNKPQSMLTASPKGTVPILILQNRKVIDESLDIIDWALAQNDQQHWLTPLKQDYQDLLELNDGRFKYYLDRYKYADRYPEHSQTYYRDQAAPLLLQLQDRLSHQTYLCGDYFSYADAAIAPFIRQFAHVDKNWFENSPYPDVNRWLESFLVSELFLSVMKKYKPWEEQQAPVIFP